MCWRQFLPPSNSPWAGPIKECGERELNGVCRPSTGILSLWKLILMSSLWSPLSAIISSFTCDLNFMKLDKQQCQGLMPQCQHLVHHTDTLLLSDIKQQYDIHSFYSYTLNRFHWQPFPLVLWKKKNSIGPGVLKKSLAIGIGRPTYILLPRSCVIVNCHRFCIEKVLAKKANSWVRVNLKWSILMFSCCLLSDGCLAAWSTSR